MSPGWVGCQPSSSRVSVLEAGLSSGEEAGQPAEVLARRPRAAIEATGRSRCRPITSAIVADRHALVGDRVQHRSRRRLLQRQAEQARGVEAVHGGPAVGAVADVAGDALVAGDADQGGHEAVVAVAVHGRARAARPTSGRRGRRARARPRCVGAAARRARRRRGAVRPRSRRGPARARATPEAITNGRSGARERLAERLDRARGRRRPRPPSRRDEVVLEGEVDDAVGRGGAGAQAVEVVEGAAVHLGPGGGEGRGRGVRAGEPEDLVAGAESSGTTAEPIQPDAPVTKTRMGNLRRPVDP